MNQRLRFTLRNGFFLFFSQFRRRVCPANYVAALRSTLVTLSSSKCLSKFNSRGGDFELMSVLEETVAPTSEVLGGNYIFPLSHFF